jgi:hypothetical protein
MDPNACLNEIRYLLKDIDWEVYDERITSLLEHVQALDEWLTKDGFIPKDWVSTEHRESANGEPRMTDAQRNRLWELCGNYNVPFRENDYVLSSKQATIGAGWVEGWVGGNMYSGIVARKTIYVGVSPEGESHS